MDTFDSDADSLQINVSKMYSTATIHLRGHFSFGAHREFKSVYKKKLQNPEIDAIVVNFAEVKYLDSAALGMLLLLREHAKVANKSLALSSANPLVGRIFDIANFHKIFTIN